MVAVSRGKLVDYLKSHRFWYIAVILTMGVLFVGVPLLGLHGMQVPGRGQASVFVGTIEPLPLKTDFLSCRWCLRPQLTAPMVVRRADGIALAFSCASPSLTSRITACFPGQSSHRGKLVKVYWSEQPSGYLSGSVKRPSRIEAVAGEVLFSEQDAQEKIAAERRSHLYFLAFLVVLAGLFYYPSMVFLDWVQVAERRRSTHGAE